MWRSPNRCYRFYPPGVAWPPELQTCGVDLYTCLVREPRALGGKDLNKVTFPETNSFADPLQLKIGA